MKKLIPFALLGFLTCCQDAQKIASDPKIQKDSEELVQDVVEIAESALEDELNMNLHKKDSNEKAK